MIEDSVSAEGEITIEAYDSDNVPDSDELDEVEPDETRCIENLTTAEMHAQLAKAISPNESIDGTVDYLGFGSDGTTAQESDSELKQGEFYKDLQSVTRNGDVLTAEVEILENEPSANSAIDIREVALFSGDASNAPDSSHIMWNRGTIPTIEKNENRRLVITVKLSFSAK